MSSVTYLPFTLWGRSLDKETLEPRENPVNLGPVKRQTFETLEKLRSTAIEGNLTRTDPHVLKVTTGYGVDYSPRFIVTRFRNLYNARVFWHSLKTILIIAGAVFLLKQLSIVAFFKDRITGLNTRELFWYRSGSNVTHRAYQIKDFVIEILCLQMGIGALCKVMFSFVRYNISQIQTNHRVAIRKSERKYLQLIYTVSEIQSSLSQFPLDQLSNKKTEDGWQDPIQFVDYPETEIRAPQRIRVGKYALDIASIIMVIFKRPLSPEGLIPHPLIPGQYLNREEHTQFLNDFTAVFCLKAETFLACWRIAPRLFKVGRIYRVTINEPCYPFGRLINFLNLLPEPVVNKYAPQWVSSEHRIAFEWFGDFLQQQQANAWSFSVYEQRPLGPLYALLQQHWPPPPPPQAVDEENAQPDEPQENPEGAQGV